MEIMKAHILCLTFKMTSYLFSFSFHHVSHLTSLDIKKADGVSVAEAGPRSAVAGEKRGKDNAIERDKHAAVVREICYNTGLGL